MRFWREKIVVVDNVVVKKKKHQIFLGHTPFVCVFLFASPPVSNGQLPSFFLSFLFACERRRKQ